MFFSRAFLQTFNLHEHSPELEGFCLSSRFGKIAADLMGVNAVRHYYNKPMFKEPSSWITPWHQDGPHWPITSNNMLTMWIALVDIDYDMGPVRFASKTHKNKYYGPKGIMDLSDLDQDGIVRDPYFGGRIHGEIADSNRNPILFSYNNS